MMKKCKKRKFQTGGSMLAFNQYVPTFVGRPVDRIAETSKTLAEANQKIVNDVNTIDLLLAQEEVLSSDYGVIEQAKSDLKAGIQDIATSDNYNLARARLNKIAKDSYLANKDLRSAKEEYAKFKQYDNQLYSRIGTDLSREDYEKAKAISMSEYGGIQNGSKFTPFVPSPDVDIAAFVDQYGKGFMANALGEAGYTIKDGYIYKNGQKVMEVEVSRVMDALKTALKNNPKISRYVNDRYTLDSYGADLDMTQEDYYNNILNQFIDYGVKKYSYKQTFDDKDVTPDNTWATLAKEQMRNRGDYAYGALPAFGGPTGGIKLDKDSSIVKLADKLKHNIDTDFSKNFVVDTEDKSGWGRFRDKLKMSTNESTLAGGDPKDLSNQADTYNNIARYLTKDESFDIRKSDRSTEKAYNAGKELDKRILDFIEKEYASYLTSPDLSYLANEHYEGEYNPKDSPQENLTRLYFGNYIQVPEDGMLPGMYKDNWFIDPKTNEVFEGDSDKMKNIIKELPQGAPVSINGRYSAKNPFTIVSGGIDNFANSYDVQIGTHRFVMAGKDREPIYINGIAHPNLTQENRIVNRVYNSRHFKTGVDLPLYIKSMDSTVNTKVNYEEPTVEYDAAGNPIKMNEEKYIIRFNDTNGKPVILESSNIEELLFGVSNYNNNIQ